MRKGLALILALLLCFGAVSVGSAETEYPPRPQGTVADLAGVLGETAISDLETLSQRVEEETGGQIFVLTRHFLGGMNVQTYADKVFEVWNLGDMDVLALMVIGEESYALSFGATARGGVSADTRTSLLATHFRSAFLDRRYDDAAADLTVSLGETLCRAFGGSLNTKGLFGSAAAQSTPQPQSPSEFWNSMFARDDYDTQEEIDNNYWQDWRSEWQREETSINWRSVIIWGLVLYFLFFRKKRRKNRG